MQKKYIVLCVALLNLTALMSHYECTQEFIEAWNIKDINQCHKCTEREKEVEKEKR